MDADPYFHEFDFAVADTCATKCAATANFEIRLIPKEALACFDVCARNLTLLNLKRDERGLMARLIKDQGGN